MSQHLETIDIGSVQRRISAMLARRWATGEERLALLEVEHLLTEGYARALTLESVRLRIDRHVSKLGSVGDPKFAARMLPRLGLRRAALERDIRRLRDSLDELAALAARLHASGGGAPSGPQSRM